MEVRNLKLRKESLDRAERRCEKCGTFKGLRVYYEIAPPKGGEDTLENAAVLCPDCHREYLFLSESSVSYKAWLSLPPAPVVMQVLLESPG
ncbi:MAG TPA: HNH endonuclease signature motif containing protein, partial [Synergistaceae bacterium]|nr:HNH endonuclease signature motif containing protein [Synergistaceae bacterium]